MGYESIGIEALRTKFLLNKQKMSEFPRTEWYLTGIVNDDFRNLKAIKDRDVSCYMISCKNSTNIDSVIDWLIKHPKSRRWVHNVTLLLSCCLFVVRFNIIEPSVVMLYFSFPSHLMYPFLLLSFYQSCRSVICSYASSLIPVVRKSFNLCNKVYAKGKTGNLKWST